MFAKNHGCTEYRNNLKAGHQISSRISSYFLYQQQNMFGRIPNISPNIRLSKSSSKENRYRNRPEYPAGYSASQISGRIFSWPNIWSDIQLAEYLAGYSASRISGRIFSQPNIWCIFTRLNKIWVKEGNNYNRLNSIFRVITTFALTFCSNNRHYTETRFCHRFSFF